MIYNVSFRGSGFDAIHRGFSEPRIAGSGPGQKFSGASQLWKSVGNSHSKEPVISVIWVPQLALDVDPPVNGSKFVQALAVRMH